MVAGLMFLDYMADDKSTNDWEDEYAYTTEMCRRYIIPNWYLPEHFDAMEGWSEERVDNFKRYLTNVVCAYDSVKDFVEDVSYSFIQESPEGETGE